MGKHHPKQHNFDQGDRLDAGFVVCPPRFARYSSV